MKRYIVVGSSAAGIACASKLRELDKECEIYIISSSKYLPYNKCLLADFLLKSITPERLFYRDLKFFEDNNIKIYLNTTVTKIEPENNKVFFDDNYLSYDSLFLGLGASPILPDIKGIKESKKVFSFNSLEDIYAISNFLENNKVKKVCIIGSGLTGIECSDSFSSMGYEVTLFCRQDYILSNLLDQEGAFFIENLMLSRKINLIKNKTLDSVDNSFDLYILATGVCPNITLALNSGLKSLNSSLFVDNYQKTSIENIYAGGDLCLVKDIVTKNLVRSCTWPDAVFQGIVAASNMVGIKQEFPGILLTASSRVFDTTFVSVKLILNNNNNNNFKTIVNKTDFYYHKYLVQEKNLIGFIKIGEIKDIANLKNIILNQEIFDTV